MEMIEGLERAYDQLGKLVSGLAPGQLEAGTPCAGWDVRALLNHTYGACWMFTLVNKGEELTEDGGDLVGADAATALAEVSAANIASWKAPGALDGNRSYPFGTFPAAAAIGINLGEVVVHTWDLAKATGQDATVDPELAALVDGFYRPIPLDEYRAHGAFGPEVTVPDTAPVTDRMLALLGRQP